MVFQCTQYLRDGMLWNASANLAKIKGSDTQTLPKVAFVGVRRRAYARWKAEIKLLRFKKNPDAKYFFIMEKNHFEFF